MYLPLSNPYRCELSLEKLSQMETLEDVTDLAKKFAVSFYIHNIKCALVFLRKGGLYRRH